MSRYTAFCNNNTDLQGVLANINDYDRKRVLPPNWEQVCTISGSDELYRLHNPGYISNLYIDGRDYETRKLTSAYTDSTANVNETFLYTDTTLTVTDGSQIAAGSFIKVGNEEMLVTAISSNDLTVERGMLGTARANHESGTDVYEISTPWGDNVEWYYDENDDALFLRAASSPNTSVVEAGQDWDGLKTTVCKEQADRIRSYINRPIYKRANSAYQGASDRDYDWILVRINAILAVADLVRSGGDTELADELEAMATNEDSSGLLDKLKSREYVLWNETSFRSESGVIQEVGVNASSTGYVEDVKLHGPPGVDYDEVKVIISTAGTFTVGSASGVKYDVYVKDSTGLKMSKIIDAQTINGNYQPLAYGAEIRFQAGVYTASDEWAVIFQSDSVAIGSCRSGQVYR